MLVIGAFHSAYFRSLLAGGWFFGQKCGKELPFQQMDERKGLEGMGLNWHFIYIHTDTIILYFHFILIAQVQTCSIHHHSSRGTLDLRRCQKKTGAKKCGWQYAQVWLNAIQLTRHSFGDLDATHPSPFLSVAQFEVLRSGTDSRVPGSYRSFAEATWEKKQRRE